MSTAHQPSALFEEIASFFATGPSPERILDFRPSQAAVERASELLELNRANRLDASARDELNQFEQAELLMRLVKARVRANRQDSVPPR